MVRYLSEDEIVAIHDRVIAESGGSAGIKDTGALSSSVALPQDGFGDFEYYPTVAAKAGALCYFLAQNHCFADGNKRTAYQSMFVFLRMNGHTLNATTDEAEAAILQVANHKMTQDEFFTWVEDRVVSLNS